MGCVSFDNLIEARAETKYINYVVVEYSFPVHFTDKFNWKGFRRGRGEDFDSTVGINVAYTLTKTHDKIFIKSQIKEDRYVGTSYDVSVDTDAEPMTFDYADFSLERRAYFLADKMSEVEAKVFGEAITDKDGGITKTDINDLSLNFQYSDVMNKLGIYDIDGVRYYSFSGDSPALFSDADANFYKKYYSHVFMSVNLDDGKYLSDFNVVMDNYFKPLFFLTRDYLYKLKEDDVFVDTDSNITVEYGKSLLPYITNGVYTYIGNKYVKFDMSDVESFDVDNLVNNATPFSEYKSAINALVDRWASLDNYTKGVSNLNSDNIFKGIKFNFNKISKWNVGGLVPKLSVKSVPDTEALAFTSEPRFKNEAVPDDTKPVDSDTKAVDLTTDWYGYNDVKSRLQFYQNVGANVSSKDDYEFVGFGRTLADFSRSGDFSDGVIDDNELFARNPKYLTKNTSLDKFFYFSSISVPRTKEDAVDIVTNNDGTTTTLSFFKNSEKLPILPFSGGAFSIRDGYVENYILSDITIKNSLNDTAVWSSDGTSVSCLVGNDIIKRNRRDGFNRGTIIYIPSGDYIYGISIVNIPFKYVNKSYLVWDVANADFIYKKFPRAEFSYLLDFTDKSDNTVVRKVAPDGEDTSVFDEYGDRFHHGVDAPKFKVHEFEHGVIYGIREDIYDLWHGVETAKGSNLLRKCDITKYMNVASMPNKVKANRIFTVDDLLGVDNPIEADVSADMEVERVPVGDDIFSVESSDDDYEVRFSVNGSEGSHPHLIERSIPDYHYYYVYNLYLKSGVKNEPKYIYLTLKDKAVRAFTDGENDRLVFIKPDENYVPKDGDVLPKLSVEPTPVISYNPPVPVSPIKVVETTPSAIVPNDTVAVITKSAIVNNKKKVDRLVNVSGHIKYKSGKPYMNMVLRIGDEAVRTDKDGYFKFRHKPRGTYNVVSELFSAKLDLRGINTVSDVTSSNNVNVTRLISSDGVEFNIICDLTPISNHIVEVNDNKQLPTTGGSSYVYTIYGIMLLLSSILLSFRKEVIK